jgi:hypothetical protein
MPDELPDLPTLTADIEARGLDPDVAAEAIRMWRDEARPLVAGAAETQEDRWTFVDELDNRAEAAINDQRKRATTMWAANRFQDPGDLAMFQKAYSQSQGDPTRMGKIKTEDGTTVSLDSVTSSRFSDLADELNQLATLPEFRGTREERDMTGKINVGDATLARYTTRIAGGTAEIVMTPDKADAKPIGFEVPVPTDDEVKAEIESQKLKLADLREASNQAYEIADLQADPEQARLSREYDAKAAEIEARVGQLSGRNGRSILLNDRIREKVKGDEFSSIGEVTWGQDFFKGLQNATFSAAGLVSRVLPGTTERVLEGVGALPDTGNAPTAPDRALNFFAEAQGQQDAALPGSTRNALVGGYLNELTQSARQAAGEMLPSVVGGYASSAMKWTGSKVAMEALKAAGKTGMGVSGATMGAGMSGGSYLESARRIADAERNGDTETADRIRRGMDAHALLTGALGATVSKFSPLHNLELSGAGMKSLGLDVLKEGLEEPFEGFIQRAVIDPATLGDHPDVFEPMAQEFGVGMAMAFPLGVASKTIEALASRKAQIATETKAAKSAAVASGADDDLTMEALDQAHQVKVAAATEQASNEVMAIATQIKEIDDKLIAVETDASLDEQTKKDAREPLIKAKLELYAGPAKTEVEVTPMAEAQPPVISKPAPAEVAPIEPVISNELPVSDATSDTQMQASQPPQKGGIGTIVPRMPDHPLGTEDILDFVNGQMLIGPPRSATGPAGDMDWKEQRSVPPFYQQRLFSKYAESGINEVADAAFRAGKIPEATPDALMTAIFSAIDNRMKARADQKTESRNLREGERQMIDFDQEQAKLEALPSATEINLSEMAKGDQVTVGGETMTVNSVTFDEDGRAQAASLASPRFGEIKLDVNHRTSVMADKPITPAEINTDFLPADEITDDQRASSPPSTPQLSQESQPLPGQASASNPGQQGEARSSSGEDTPNGTAAASPDSPEVRSGKNAAMDAWLAKRGMKPMAKGESRAWSAAKNKAFDTLAKDRGAGQVTAERLIASGKGHTDDEYALMLVDFMEQENARDAAAKTIANSDSASPEFEEAQIRMTNAEAAIEKSVLALRLSGREQGRGLNIRKMGIDRSEVPSQAVMIAERKIALGNDFTEADRQEVIAKHKELTEAKAGADAANAEIESDQLQADNAATVDEIANEILKLSSDPEGRKKIGQKAREKLKAKAEAAMKILREKGVIGGKTTNAMGLGGALDADAMKAMIDVATYYIVEAGGVVADALNRFTRDFPQIAKDTVQSIFDDAQKANERLNTKLEEISKSNAAKDKRKTPAQIIDKAKYLLEPDGEVDPSVVRALHRAHIEDGSKSEADVTNKVAESLREIYGREFTPDEVRRIHTQYGKVAQLPADEVSKIQRDLKRQQLLLVKIEALKKQQPLLATGVDREKNSHEVHVLQQELEAIKKSANYRKTGEGQLSGLQDRIAARLDTLIADTKDQLLGNKPVRSGRSATEYDADNMDRLSRLKVLRKELRVSRSTEVDAAANEAAVKAAKAMKAEWERRLAGEEWRKAAEPKRQKSRELKEAISERDQAAADYHEAERNSAEWKTREVARKVAALSEELDTLEQKLADRDTSRGKKKAKGPTSDELKMMEDRKVEINSELDDIRKREPMTSEQERIYLEERLKAAEATETDLQNELSTGKKKDIFRRERPTSPALKAAQERIKDLRKKVADMRYGDGQAAFDKWAKARIATLNDQLANGRKPGSNRSYPDTAENRAKVAEIKSLEAEMKRKEAPAKKLKSIQDKIERKKKEITRLQVEGFKAKPSAAAPVDTPEIKAAKADLDALQKIEEEWHANDGERDNAAYVKRLDAAEKVMQDKIDRGDFAPKVKKEIKLKPETVERVKRFRDLQEDYHRQKLAWQYERLPWHSAQKLWRKAAIGSALIKVLKTGLDAGVMGIQLWKAAHAHFPTAVQAFVEGVKSLGFQGLLDIKASDFSADALTNESDSSLKKAMKILFAPVTVPTKAIGERGAAYAAQVQMMLERLPAIADGTAEAAGMIITDPTGQRAAEETFEGIPSHKIPLIAASERMFRIPSNFMRATIFNRAVMNMRARGLSSPEMNKVLASDVNAMSGRANWLPDWVKNKAGIKSTAGIIMWAPGILASKLQDVVMYDLIGRGNTLPGPELRAYKGMVAKRYAVMAMTTAASYALMKALHSLIGGDDDKNEHLMIDLIHPTSRLGRVRVGRSAVDLTGGRAGLYTFLHRLFTQSKSTEEQKGQPLWGKVPFGQDDSGDVMSSFVKGKLSVPIGTIWQFMVNRDFSNKTTTKARTLVSVLIPITPGQMAETMSSDLSMGEKSIMSLLSLVGVDNRLIGVYDTKSTGDKIADWMGLEQPVDPVRQKSSEPKAGSTARKPLSLSR